MTAKAHSAAMLAAVGALVAASAWLAPPLSEPFQLAIQGSTTTSRPATTTSTTAAPSLAPPVTQLTTQPTVTVPITPPGTRPGPVAAPPTVPPPPAPSTTAGFTADPEAEVVIAVATDALRVEAGLSSLAPDEHLAQYARSWAWHMASTGELEHSDISQLIDGWVTVGENIGAGGEAEAVFEALVASPSHLAIILENDFTAEGVGVVEDAQGVLWVVQVLAGHTAMVTTTTLLPEVTIPGVTVPTLPLP